MLKASVTELDIELLTDTVSWVLELTLMTVVPAVTPVPDIAIPATIPVVLATFTVVLEITNPEVVVVRAVVSRKPEGKVLPLAWLNVVVTFVESAAMEICAATRPLVSNKTNRANRVDSPRQGRWVVRWPVTWKPGGQIVGIGLADIVREAYLVGGAKLVVGGGWLSGQALCLWAMGAPYPPI